MFGIPPMSSHLAAEVGVRERETGSRMENRRSEREEGGETLLYLFCRWRDPLRKTGRVSARLSHHYQKEREREKEGGEGRGEGGDRRWLE